MAIAAARDQHHHLYIVDAAAWRGGRTGLTRRWWACFFRADLALFAPLFRRIPGGGHGAGAGAGGRDDAGRGWPISWKDPGVSDPGVPDADAIRRVTFSISKGCRSASSATRP